VIIPLRSRTCVAFPRTCPRPGAAWGGRYNTAVTPRPARRPVTHCDPAPVSELPPASLAEVASTRLTEEDGVRIDWGARRRPGILNPQGLPAGLAVFSLSSTASAIGYADGPPACPTRWNTHRPPRPRRTTTRPTARPPPAKRGHSPSPDRTRSSPRSTAIPCSGPATPP
jgi:hypothetical protein